MAQTAKRLISGSQLTGSAATYYTTPAATSTVIKKLVLINTTAAPVACTIYLIPSGGSAGVTNSVTVARSIGANESWSCPEAENMVLPTGGFLQALGLNVTIMASGIEIGT